MTPLGAVLALGPMLGALVGAVMWLIATLTRIENRVTKLEVMMDTSHGTKPSRWDKYASFADADTSR